MPFTFKATGAYHIGRPGWSRLAVKLNRNQVGTINDETPHKIRLAIKKVPTAEEPAPFEWITLKRKSESVRGAKDFLNQHFDTIMQKYDLHQFEDWI